MTQIKNFSSKQENVSLKYLVMVIEVTREKIPACIFLDGMMERSLHVRSPNIDLEIVLLLAKGG